MSTLRQDPTTRQWVILAPRRAERPHQPEAVPRPALPDLDPSCPFCPGNEEQTPPEVARAPKRGHWQVRVVPNLYAALGGDGPGERGGSTLFREMAGIGSHEVIVETPRHSARLDEMDPGDVEKVMWMWRERYRELIARPEIRAVVVFKNFGLLAGTSLTHPHSQVVATPVFLPRLLRRVDVATRYYDDTGQCVYDDVLRAEREAGSRIVAEEGTFVALEPFASNSPFETWIVPTVHRSNLGAMPDEEIHELARILIKVLGAIRRACGDPDYNLVVFSAPANGHPEGTFLWHIKILPKLATPAGFELGSAMSINTVPPEDAALALREALRTTSPLGAEGSSDTD